MAESGVKHGWRTVVFNNRCCSGAPITSSRMIACYYDDIEFAMDHVRKVFKPTFVFIVGFSLGGFQMIEYLMRGPVADAAVCVSHTYDPAPAEKLLHKPLESVIYQKVMMAKLTHLVKKNRFWTAQKQQTRKHSSNTTTLFGVIEFHNTKAVKSCINH